MAVRQYRAEPPRGTSALPWAQLGVRAASDIAGGIMSGVQSKRRRELDEEQLEQRKREFRVGTQQAERQMNLSALDRLKQDRMGAEAASRMRTFANYLSGRL